MTLLQSTDSSNKKSSKRKTNDRPRRLSLFRRLFYSLVFVLIFFLVLEGACSVAIVCKHAFYDPPLAERLHTEYDSELGWINKPNYSHPDLYGTGISLQTNSQRFRQAEDVSKEVPQGRVRVIVSGDSFALGYGVGDQETWCAQLAELEPQLEVVNLGQGGYGLDQAYLWYKRIRDEFDHDVYLCTFITADFDRMRHRNFSGYGKPVLTVENEQLVVQNTPVPQMPYLLSKLARKGTEFQQLSTFRVARRLFAPPEPPAEADEAMQQTRDVTAAIARELQTYHEKQGSLLVVVHLPTDYAGEDIAWNNFLTEESQRAGWKYLDLSQDFNQLSEAEREKLFLKPGDVDYPGAAGHYNKDGNAYIAQLLLSRLREFDEFSKRFQELEAE